MSADAVRDLHDSRSFVAGLRADLATSGLALRPGLEPRDDDALRALAASLSDQVEEKLLAWDFGTVMHMTYDPDAPNYLFSAEAVPLHWDGAFHREPRYLLFFCDRAAGSGGETHFVDTEALVADLDAATRERWEHVTLTYSTEKKAHYGGRFSTPAIRRHPFSGRPVLRFAEAVATERNPVHLEIAGGDPERLYAELEARVRDPRYRTTHRWRPGDLLIVDNHRHLHGRAPLGANTGRAFRRVQIL